MLDVPLILKVQYAVNGCVIVGYGVDVLIDWALVAFYRYSIASLVGLEEH